MDAGHQLFDCFTVSMTGKVGLALVGSVSLFGIKKVAQSSGKKRSTFAGNGLADCIVDIVE